MTSKEAFSLALDELGFAVAEDDGIKRARIAARRVEQAKTNAIKTGKPFSLSDITNKSLAQHLAEGCKAQKPENCKYVKKMQKELVGQGLDPRKALQQAVNLHSRADVDAGENPNGEFAGVDSGKADEIAGHIVDNPGDIDEVEDGQLLENPEDVDTPYGAIRVSTVAQKAALEALVAKAKAGDANAENAIADLADKQRMDSMKASNGNRYGTMHGTGVLKEDPYAKLMEKIANRNGGGNTANQNESEYGVPIKLPSGQIGYVSMQGYAKAMAILDKLQQGGLDNYDKVVSKWDAIAKNPSEARNFVREGILKYNANPAGDGLPAGFEEIVEPLKVLDEQMQAALEARDMKKYTELLKQKTVIIKNFKEQQKLIVSGDKHSPNNGSSTSSSGENTAVGNAMNEMHNDGGCAMSGMSVDAEGNIKTDDSSHAAMPDASILSGPASKKEARIDNLEDKIKKLVDFIASKGMTVSDVSSETSFNNTFVNMKVDSSADAKKIEKMVDDLIGEVGGSVGFAYDPKTRTVVLSLENDVKGDVSAKEILESEEWKKAKESMACPIAIGKDMSGKPVIVDMKDLIHLLVGGETGQGKSVSMNTILTSMMMGANPNDVKFILLDPKGGVEFGGYEKAKHNLFPVARDTASSIERLKWLQREMDNRQNLFDRLNRENGTDFKNIDDYNKWAKANGKETMPRIVLAVDELTELRKDGGEEFNSLMGTLGNKARFTGIHLICATQNPTKANIGDVKDNFPSRLGFHTTSSVQSNNILGHGTKVDPETGEVLIGTNALKRRGEFVLEYEKGKSHGQGAMLENGDVGRVIDAVNGKAPSTTPTSSSPSSAESAGEGDDSTTGKHNAEDPTTQENKGATGEVSTSTPSESSVQQKVRDWNNVDDRKAELQDIYDEELSRINNNKSLTRTEKYDARIKLEKEHKRRMNELESEFSHSSDGGSDSNKDEAGGSTENKSPIDEYHSSENRKKRALSRLENGRKAIEKKAAHDGWDRTRLHGEIKRLEDAYSREIQDIDAGMSEEDIVNRDREERIAREKKNATLRKSIVTMRKGKPIPFAVEGVTRGNKDSWMPMSGERIAQAKKVLPEGWRLDGGSKPLVDNWGRTGARNPDNGSYGYVDSNGELHVIVDTSHPEYKGESSEEARAALNEKNGNPDNEDLRKKYNRIAFGHDEGLRPRDFVLSAILSYLDS